MAYDHCLSHVILKSLRRRGKVHNVAHIRPQWGRYFWEALLDS